MGPRFFLPLMIRLAVVAAGPLAVGWWLVGPIGGGAAAVVLLALELWRIDRTVRTAADDRVSYTPTPPGDLTWLDEDAIRESLRDLRSVGFRPIADCTYHLPVAPAGFTRVLTHRGERVYACVAQGRRGTHAPEAVAVTLVSALDDGRTLTTTSSQPSSTMAFGLERTDAWQIRPGASVQDLITEHLATRATLATRGPTGVSGDGTLATFVAVQTAIFHRQAQECRMNGALGAIRRGMKWERHGHKSWVDGVFSKKQAIIARPLHPVGPPASTAPPTPVTPASPTDAPPATRPAAAEAPRPARRSRPAGATPPTTPPVRKPRQATPALTATPVPTSVGVQPAAPRVVPAAPTAPREAPDPRRGRRRSPPSPTYGTDGPSDTRPHASPPSAPTHPVAGAPRPSTSPQPTATRAIRPARVKSPQVAAPTPAAGAPPGARSAQTTPIAGHATSPARPPAPR